MNDTRVISIRNKSGNGLLSSLIAAKYLLQRRLRCRLDESVWFAVRTRVNPIRQIQIFRYHAHRGWGALLRERIQRIQHL